MHGLMPILWKQQLKRQVAPAQRGPRHTEYAHARQARKFCREARFAAALPRNKQPLRQGPAR